MPRSSQQGYVLLLLLLVMLVTGSSVLLAGFNNRQQLINARNAETLYQLMQAKEALLAFAANSASLYNHTRGPGYLPCPDGDGDGFPDEAADGSCDSDEPLVGRLPDIVRSGTTISNITRDVRNPNAPLVNRDPENRFWYVVAPRHAYNSDEDLRVGELRSSAESPALNLRLVLDGNPNYVALLIAPGEALDFQNRIDNLDTFTEYVESALSTSPFDFISRIPVNYNDIVVGITHDEYMRKVGAVMAGIVKNRLADYYDDHNAYPDGKTAALDSNGVTQEFLDNFEVGLVPGWMRTEGWYEHSTNALVAPNILEELLCGLPWINNCQTMAIRRELAGMFRMESMQFISYPLTDPNSFTLLLPGCRLEFQVTASKGFRIQGDSC